MGKKYSNPPIVEAPAQIEKVINRLLQNGIMMPHPNEVRNYLLRYQDMIDLLPPVCKTVLERFEKTHSYP